METKRNKSKRNLKELSELLLALTLEKQPKATPQRRFFWRFTFVVVCFMVIHLVVWWLR